MSEFLPRSYAGSQPAVTRFGVAVATPDGGYSVDLGRPEELNWHWDASEKVLSVQLVTGSGALGGAVAPPTSITNGVLREDGKEIAGTLAEILNVIQRAPEASSGTQTRAQVQVLDPKTGLAVLRGDLLVHTTEGLANLHGVLTSGGMPRTEFDRDAQGGAVPAAIDVNARIASWRILDLSARFGLSMPIHYFDNAIVQVTSQSSRGAFQETGIGGYTGNAEDATAQKGSAGVVEVWGRMDPLNASTYKALSESLRGTDPEQYQNVARWAPHFYLDPEKIWGDDEPPPEDEKKKKKKKETGDPGGEDEEEEEEENQNDDEPPDPKNPQERNLTAPEVAAPGGFVGILLPPLATPIGAKFEAFVTETGNAVSPHPVTISLADEDDEDADSGGIPLPLGVPLVEQCPLEDPSAEEAGTIPTSFPGSGTGTGTGGDGIDRGFGLPPFPLPDLGAGILFL